MKNILFASSECVPFIKTGGLADVVGSLPKDFDKEKYDVRVVIPKYMCMKQEWKEKLEYITNFYMDIAGQSQYVGIFRLVHDGVTFYFIDNEYYFSGFAPYDGDPKWNIEKFAFFSKAVLSILPVIGFRPELIHCHDWQTGLIPVYLDNFRYLGEYYRGIKTVMTIHNLKFQGIYDRKKIQYWSGLPDYVFNKDCMIQNWLDANMLKGGIAYSNKVTTVSNTYAWEIQTEEYGEGLAEHLRYHNNKILGIVNGIDTDIWNPATDKLLAADYDEKSAIKNKKINKKALQESLGLDVDEHKMVIGLISRLTNQKGLDLVNDVIPGIMDEHTQVVVLGTGDSQYENTFRYYENKYKGNFCAYIAYNRNCTISHGYKLCKSTWFKS